MKLVAVVLPAYAAAGIDVMVSRSLSWSREVTAAFAAELAAIEVDAVVVAAEHLDE